MKKWLTLLIISILLASIGLNAYLLRPYMTEAQMYKCDDSEYVVYRPVYYNLKRSRPIESPFIIDTSNVAQSHYKRFQFVMKYHRKPFRVDAGNILIKRTLWEDKDYIANLTQKANDTNWLSSKKYMD